MRVANILLRVFTELLYIEKLNFLLLIIVCLCSSLSCLIFFFFFFFPINLYRQLTTIVNKIRYMQATDVSENKLTRKKKKHLQYITVRVLLYPQTKVGDILDSGPSRRRRRRRRRNFLVDAITQKQINIFFSNLVHMLRVSKGRSLF